MNTLNIKNLTPEQIKDLRDQLNNYDKNEMSINIIKQYVFSKWNKKYIHDPENWDCILINEDNEIIINPKDKINNNDKNEISSIKEIDARNLKPWDIYLDNFDPDEPDNCYIDIAEICIVRKKDAENKEIKSMYMYSDWDIGYDHEEYWDKVYLIN